MSERIPDAALAVDAREGAPVAYAEVGEGLRLAYETFGEPNGRPLVLIMGLASSMLIWDDGFCRALAARGHYVVRFDNRDIGLSSRLRHLGRPKLWRIALAVRLGWQVDLPYRMEDMASDTVRLLDALGIARAHIMGASMGGMIAQTVALRFPERVASLVSLMSHTGDRRLPRPAWRATRALMRRPPRDKEGYIHYCLRLWRDIGSPGFPFPEERIRQRSGRVFDNGPAGSGALRQLAAVIAQEDRRRDLSRLDLPCLVIHGLEDPLVRVEGGRQTAECIPGATLKLYPGMGHNLPEELWAEVADAVAELTTMAERV